MQTCQVSQAEYIFSYFSKYVTLTDSSLQLIAELVDSCDEQLLILTSPTPVPSVEKIRQLMAATGDNKTAADIELRNVYESLTAKGGDRERLGPLLPVFDVHFQRNFLEDAAKETFCSHLGTKALDNIVALQAYKDECISSCRDHNEELANSDLEVMEWLPSKVLLLLSVRSYAPDDIPLPFLTRKFLPWFRIWFGQTPNTYAEVSIYRHVSADSVT
jgi:hypothetical protein